MHDPNYSANDSQGYDLQPLPYIPYASPTQQPDISVAGSQNANPGNSQETQGKPVMSEQTSGDGLPVVPAKRSRRRRWIVPGALVAIVIISSALAFALVSYINRSTPSKTLDTFCSAVQQEKYDVAYAQFSKQLQRKFTEQAFSDVLHQDKIVHCTHGTPNDGGTSVHTNLKLVHSSQGINNDQVLLRKDENSTWKIDDLQRA